MDARIAQWLQVNGCECPGDHPVEADEHECIYGLVQHEVMTLEAENQRLRGVLKDFAEYDCEYGDGCPKSGSRHGRCVGCIARDALGPKGGE